MSVEEASHDIARLAGLNGEPSMEDADAEEQDGHAADGEAERDGNAGRGGRSKQTARVHVVADPLYGETRVASWALALLETPPFRRLAGVSLSDVPGGLLFGPGFPSRLDHAIGVYALARLARPRDRALQAAALAHDLGHGPFSHLSETLMLERLGMDHEQRSVALLAGVRAALSPAAARQLDWLDWDEVARLMLGDCDGRGALLNGMLDYDNADNVARFLLTGRLAQPGYDPRVLARALRIIPDEPQQAEADGERDAGRTRLHQVGAQAERPNSRTYIQAQAEEAALAWQADRAKLYTFLHEGHVNLASHAMLRKAVDLAAADGLLANTFFDATDAEALALLAAMRSPGIAGLAQRVLTLRPPAPADAWASADAYDTRALYRNVWEATLPQRATPPFFTRWRERLAVEARLAAEAGLSAHEVVVDALVSRAWRPLPPFASPQRPKELFWLPTQPGANCTLRVYVTPQAGRDYARRLRMAAKRVFAPLGAAPRALSPVE